jgi:hypothetical protein
MMTVEERTAYFKEVFETCIVRLSDTKGKDYGGKIANSNFHEAAARRGISPMQVWGVYFDKHLAAVDAYIREGRVESEPIEGRIDDMITYLFILRSMVREGRSDEPIQL